MNQAFPIIGMFAALLFLTWGVLHFCLLHNPDFDNPVYANCIRGLHSPHDCELRILDRQVARDRARHIAQSAKGSE
ncbi:hypothetical protein Geu3261_0144_035 [Komagataeibacter europaeus NBRC 3261]|uniref:Uncharacterized protein n=1 Tax=Komagataeibacter europaeus NBRC 3261 TaxID=1234669 RepID=A0A0D6Q1H4_KOMEU|nr:hypothetical protein [Komagataeibacter europaeus]GAN97163.1 hypothetical protein Geu3261_0144_035 [Komagataeibacter europaeus NBRC 3261]